MSAIYSFKNIENKHNVYRTKDCNKKFCEFLREYAMKIINYKKTENEAINKREARITGKCKNHLCLVSKFENQYIKDQKYHKVKDHCH